MRAESGARLVALPDFDETQQITNSVVRIPDVNRAVLSNLLTYVVNRGDDPINLKVVDEANYDVPCTLCIDTMFYLMDQKGCSWTIDIFYGTCENLFELDRLNKRRWIILLMHLALTMVQKLKRCDDMIGNSIIVTSRNLCVCKVKFIVDLKGLHGLDYGCKRLLLWTLKNMSRRGLAPIFKLMTAEQESEMEKVLEGSLYDDEKHWAAIGLNGYFAICYKEMPVLNGLNYTSKEAYRMMAEYDRQFDGDCFFIAVGRTLPKLLKDIEKRAWDIEYPEIFFPSREIRRKTSNPILKRTKKREKY